MIEIRVDRICMSMTGADIVVPVDLGTYVAAGSNENEVTLVTQEGRLILRGERLAMRLLAKDIIDRVRPRQDSLTLRMRETPREDDSTDRDQLEDFRPGGTI